MKTHEDSHILGKFTEREICTDTTQILRVPYNFIETYLGSGVIFLNRWEFLNIQHFLTKVFQEYFIQLQQESM